jgi:broad specificity phosphatase PhoE
MRYVELRRHTDNDGDALTAQGVADAEAIGVEGVQPPYAAFISSGAARATQMLSILRHAAGQDDAPLSEVPALRSTVEDRWRTAARAAGKGATVEGIRRVDPDLVDHEERLLGSALRRIVESLPDGGRALVVGHSPTNEAAVAGLTGQTVEPLAKGGGVLVVEDSGRFTVRPL